MLALILAFRFFCLLLERRPPTLASFGLAALQLAILLFGLFIRSSGTWAVIAIVALTLMQWSVAVLAAPGLPWRAAFAKAARAVRFWPPILLVLGFVGFLVFRAAAPHPL